MEFLLNFGLTPTPSNLIQFNLNSQSQGSKIEPFGDYSIKNKTLADKIINDTISKMKYVNFFGNKFPINIPLVSPTFSITYFVSHVFRF